MKKFLSVLLLFIIFTFAFSNIDYSVYAKANSTKNKSANSNKKKKSKTKSKYSKKNGVDKSKSKSNTNKITTPSVPNVDNSSISEKELNDLRAEAKLKKGKGKSTTDDAGNSNSQLFKTNTLEHGTEQFFINEINDLSANAKTLGFSYKYSAWYTDSSVYFLTGNVSVNSVDKTITFDGFICKDKNSNKSNVSFTKEIGSEFSNINVDSTFKAALYSILSRCPLITSKEMFSGVVSYFKTNLPSSNFKYKDTDEHKNYALLKQDDSIVFTVFGSSNNIELAQRYIDDKFVDQIENLTFGTTKSKELLNDKSKEGLSPSDNPNYKPGPDHDLDGLGDDFGNDDDFDFGDDDDF